MYEGRLSHDFLIIFIPCLLYVLSWSVLTRHTDLLKTEKKIWSPILYNNYFYPHQHFISRTKNWITRKTKSLQLHFQRTQEGYGFLVRIYTYRLDGETFFWKIHQIHIQIKAPSLHEFLDASIRAFWCKFFFEIRCKWIPTCSICSYLTVYRERDCWLVC